jgi:hypothetical protein
MVQYYTCMSEIRDVILKKMLSLGLTIYQVAKLVEGRIPKRTVYAFLSGEKDTGTETASIIMQELGLTIKENPEKTLSIIKEVKMKSKKFRGRIIAEWEQAGKPKWCPRELLGICLLIDLEFAIEGLNPAPKFRSAIKENNFSYLMNWAQGLKFKTWE